MSKISCLSNEIQKKVKSIDGEDEYTVEFIFETINSLLDFCISHCEYLDSLYEELDLR